MAGHPIFFFKFDFNFLLFLIFFSFKKLIDILLYIKYDTWHTMDDWMTTDGQDGNMRALIFPSNIRGSRSMKKCIAIM
jgi:hypothetical protein